MAADPSNEVQLKDFDTIFRLDGKAAVVTGGSRGLGLNIASGLLQAGCHRVYITSRSAQACSQAVEALNALPNKHADARAYAIPADFSQVAEIERFSAELSRLTGHINILIANAGATWGAPFDEYPDDGFQKVMDLNVKSIFFSVQKLAPLLEKGSAAGDPSRVIITASVSGIRVGTFGTRGTYAYSASKAAAIHLAKNLAVELGPRGILSNAMAPGYFPTRLSAARLKMEGVAESLRRGSPNNRIGKREDIAALAVFLSSRGSSHINGAAIPVDGGALLSSPAL